MSAPHPLRGGPASDRRSAPVDASRTPACETRDRGVVSAELVVGFALFMIFVIVAINLAVLQYARGSVRAAVEEAARAGALSGQGVAECQAIAVETFRSLLGGPYGENIGFECTDAGDRITARGYGGFEPWIAVMPTVNIDVQVVATKELES
jgi:hypothetical protein